MMNKVLLFFVSWFIFFCVDMVWIRLIMGSFYKSEMQAFFRFNMENIHQLLGFLIWGLLVFGIMVFVLSGSQSMQSTLLKGALFGLVVYGVYDLTNFVVINGWSLKLVFVDWAWGCFVNSAMSGIMFWLSNKF